MLLYKEQCSAQIFYCVVPTAPPPPNDTFLVLIETKIYLCVPKMKMFCLIDRYFLLFLLLNLKYTHITTHTDKQKFARFIHFKMQLLS